MEGCLLEFLRGRLDRPLEFVVVVEVHRRRDRIDWSNYCFVRRRSQNSFWSYCCRVMLLCDVKFQVGWCVN